MRLLALFPLMFVVVGLGLATFSWNFGNPPTGSILAPRQQVLVIAADVEARPWGNGTTRYTPVVSVRPSNGPEVVLEGVEPSFFGADREEAESIVARYPVGESISARVIDGELYADRIDWFGALHFLFLAAITAFAGYITIMFARGIFAPSKRH